MKHVAIVETMPIMDKDRELGKYVDKHMISHLTRVLSEENYVPHRFPVSMMDDAEIIQVASQYDYFVFTGGEDIDPAFYGQEPEDANNVLRPEIDRKQILLASEAVRNEKKIIGICRGMQLLNIVAGGTLHQSLPGETHIRESLIVSKKLVSHRIKTSPGSFINKALGNEPDVLSAHHQAVNLVGGNYIPVAYSSDGIVEAMEHQNGRILAVQFHAEDTGKHETQLLPLIQFFQIGQP